MPTENQPLVSVIMNCYNSAKYLREAIDSVVAQTYSNWEIIFWDNQSTDESAQVYKSYCDQRMRYFYAPEHTVLGQARNLAVEQAKGEWLGFLDCDDMWLPEKLEKQVAIINKEGPGLGLVYGQMLVITEEKERSSWNRRMAKYQTKTRLAKLPDGYIFEKLLSDNFIPLVSAMVCSVAFSRIGGINPTYKQAEDFDLFVKITNQFQAKAVQEVIALYRVHDKNLSELQHNEAFNETIDIVCRYLPSEFAKKALTRQYVNEAVQRIRSRDVIGLLNLVKKCNGIIGLSIAFFKAVMAHLKNRLVRVR